VPSAPNERASFTVRTPEEARRLASLIAGTAAQPDLARLGLSELLLNAIEYGNLGLTGRDKCRLRANGTWDAEVARRLALPDYAQRRVVVEVSRSGEALEVSITDQGDGFDWRPWLDIDAARVHQPHGRGIALARRLCFQSLHYTGNGSRVLARFAAMDAGAALPGRERD
jgi:anti-sigma regulatory factor (Ser/Thr protein kinase)